ncbi:MAG: pentapeptide repeat-containing protein, partial [Candidatus Kapaibacterium sp.]
TARGIKIRNANLNFTNFYDCDLTNCIIEDSQLNNGEMFACNLSNSILRNNDFTNSGFEWCRFDYSDITGTTFCDSELKDVTFLKTIGDETTLCVPDSARGTKIQ